LPQQISIGTGFIIKKNENPQNEDDAYYTSKQHDIILYDNTVPLIMKYGNFIITNPKNVHGVIEVKSNLSPADFRDAFITLENSLLNLFSHFNQKFFGIFSYDFRRDADHQYDIESNNIINTLLHSRGVINHISLGENYFIRYWKRRQGLILQPPIHVDHDFYNIYTINSLSYSYFISNILHRTCNDVDERYWHSFPIDKEANRTRIVEIHN